ncbi:methionine--tRNA ligase [Haliovirga abyssi]|uniref:Methionine--tRNA ligase n=1 Tax=Haliovirga abyssi TaxID=2996794 RepID=A0AAU9D3Y6_9FUSO|nr:methionine--tRNA ligase [Haliovirga abyssi]BDU50674.1 methionine--tRNA ligase [Haliovirga abyssi]
MGKNFYVTTPIYYVNGEPHVGSAYTTIAADVLARYKKTAGYDVFFLTGTDEHGQKIEEAAKLKGMSPQEFVDSITPKFQKMWNLLNINNNDFIRTTEDRHIKSVEKIIKKVYENGDIYKGEYEGHYCVSCENFVPESQMGEGDSCPDCGKKLRVVKEESYFFKMSKYADKLLKYIEDNPNFIQPSYRKNEVTSFIKQGLKDLSISRNTFKWGIPLEIDKEHVVYVWFDALTNYLTAVGYENNPEMFDKFWNNGEVVHLLGKDILRFHAIIWPIMLMAAGEKLPSKIFAHGWWTAAGEKMSKSKGNVVNPKSEVEKYGLDAFRYFLMREVHFGMDGDYSTRAMVQRINADLANDLGNLLNRTIGMIKKYFKGVVTKGEGEEIFDVQIKELFFEMLVKVDEEMENIQFSKALEQIWKFISRMNKYIDETMPWKLAKDETKKERLAVVMYNLVESLYKIAVLVYPYMPETAAKIWNQLGINGNIEDARLENLKEWGNVPEYTTVKNAEPIFPRIEVEEKKEEIKVKSKKIEPTIEIDEFKKTKMVVAKILLAEKVEGADKLLKFKVSIGKEERTVVSGIAKYYKVEELKDKKVLMVSNLKPVKLRGILSEGMFLTTMEKKRIKLIEIDNSVPEGTLIG